MTRSIKLIIFAMILTATLTLAARSAEAATATAQKPLTATITINMATLIGDTTLPPGTYDVKITPSSDNSNDPTVQFSRFSYVVNPADGVSPEDDEVLTVEATAKDLGAPAAITGVIVTGDNEGGGLEIRGRSTEYLFDSSIVRASAAIGE
jgi:hypothetical protein